MSAFELRPALPPAERFAHGTRARYVSGCRCEPCRRANRVYARGRYRAHVLRHDWRGLVPAAPAREHLRALSAAGVGYKTAARAAHVAYGVVDLVVRGRRQQIRADTERALLAVDVGAAADRAPIDARETWSNIRWLLAQGLTRGEIAQRLGRQRAALQFGERRVLAGTARQVAALRREVEEELAASEGVPEICAECGHSHAPADRQRVIARMLPVPAAEIREAWPCFYPGDQLNDTGYRTLMRDLAAIRARSHR